MSISFLIWAPDYDIKNGGCLCLHSLADKLAILGYKSYLFANISKPGNFYQLINKDSSVWDYLEKQNTLVVYPEVIADNPLNGMYIARWFLNKPGKFGTSTNYVPEGYQYLYSDMFEVSNKDFFEGYLRVNDPMLGIFPDISNKKENRFGTFYTIRKGSEKLNSFPPNKSWLKYDFDFIESENYFAQCINRFTKSEYFISYDDATYLSVFAALCGCRSVVIPNEKISAKEWREKNINCKYGVAYGFDEKELKYAEDTLNLIEKHLLELLSFSYESVDNFAISWIKKLNKESSESTKNGSKMYKCLAKSDNHGAFSIISDINKLNTISINSLEDQSSELLSENKKLEDQASELLSENKKLKDFNELSSASIDSLKIKISDLIAEKKQYILIYRELEKDTKRKISNLLLKNIKLEKDLKIKTKDSFELSEELQKTKSELRIFKGYKLVRNTIYFAKKFHKLKIKLKNLSKTFYK